MAAFLERKGRFWRAAQAPAMCIDGPHWTARWNSQPNAQLERRPTGNSTAYSQKAYPVGRLLRADVRPCQCVRFCFFSLYSGSCALLVIQGNRSKITTSEGKV